MAHKAIPRQDPIVQVFYPRKIGTQLLEDFAAARPQDYTFLEPKDLAFCEARHSLAYQNGTHSQTMCRNVPVAVRSDRSCADGLSMVT